MKAWILLAIPLLLHSQTITGIVADPSGRGLAAAHLFLLTGEGSPMVEAVADENGRFQIERPAAGSYRLRVEAAGFAVHDRRYVFPLAGSLLNIQMEIAPGRDQLTVSATRGNVDDAELSAHIVNVRNKIDLRERPLPTIGAALEGSPGIALQTTTQGHVSPILRGLTGYQTLILFDGVRFNTSIFRSGPNQYMAYVDPSQAATLEAILGPASASYGSDALGGAISILSQEPRFAPGGGLHVNGDLAFTAASADRSINSHGSVAVSGRSFWWLAGGSVRSLNDLRAGGGLDSRHVFRRYFGLPMSDISELTGGRLRGSGFQQLGGQTKVAWRISEAQSFSALYQKADLSGLTSYRDTWGGLGRLRADFDPQFGELGYARYERRQLPLLDSISGRFSFNRISDGSVRQGLRASDPLTFETGTASVFGYSTQATTHLAREHVQVFGAEFYDERVDASGFRQLPAGNRTQVRAPFPNGSRYGTLAVFAQNVTELLHGRMRLVGGGRWTRVRFQSFADRNLDPVGRPLGVADSDERFRDATFHLGATYRPLPGWSIHMMTSRGFRAPNVSDLGGIGLSGLGYEIPASEAVRLSALLGNSAADTAGPVGARVERLKAETLRNYEIGAGYQSRRVYARVQGFLADFGSPVVRRTLLFPDASIPDQVAGLGVVRVPQSAAQRAAGVTAIATTMDPRAVKAIVNDGALRYSGMEATVRFQPAPAWTLESNYSVLGGRVLNPNRYVRRLPPQQGYVALRHMPGGRRPWFEVIAHASAAQTRLSPEDLDDERIGASRTRNDIAAFFNGSLVQPWLTDTDRGRVFAPTGETLLQIQNRVLPLGATINRVAITGDSSRVPLLANNAGFLAVDIRGGIPAGERWRIHFGMLNVTDRNYRVIGSGVDMPGRSVFAGCSFLF